MFFRWVGIYEPAFIAPVKLLPIEFFVDPAVGETNVRGMDVRVVCAREGDTQSLICKYEMVLWKAFAYPGVLRASQSLFVHVSVLRVGCHFEFVF